MLNTWCMCYSTLSTSFGEAPSNADDCVCASEQAYNLDFMNLSYPNNHETQEQLSCDDTVGSRQPQAPFLKESFDDHRPKHTGDIEDLWLQDIIHLEDIKSMVEFVRKLQSASLDDPSLGMFCEALEHLRNPLHEQSSLSIDKDTWLAIDIYLGNPSKATYEVNWKAFLCQLPGAHVPSYYKTR